MCLYSSSVSVPREPYGHVVSALHREVPQEIPVPPVDVGEGLFGVAVFDGIAFVVVVPEEHDPGDNELQVGP